MESTVRQGYEFKHRVRSLFLARSTKSTVLNSSKDYDHGIRVVEKASWKKREVRKF